MGDMNQSNISGNLRKMTTGAKDVAKTKATAAQAVKQTKRKF